MKLAISLYSLALAGTLSLTTAQAVVAGVTMPMDLSNRCWFEHSEYVWLYEGESNEFKTWSIFSQQYEPGTALTFLSTQ